MMDEKALAYEQGQRIIQLRNSTRLTRRAFARRNNISPGTLQNWEVGRYQGLSTAAVNTLIESFKKEGVFCTSDWLLYGKGAHPSLGEAPTKTAEDLSPLITAAMENAAYRAKNEKLYSAVKECRHSEVVKLIKEGADLHLHQGFDIHHYDNHENTPLHHAAMQGHFQIVKTLIKYEAPINSINRRRQTPLHLAVQYGYNEIITYLILHGADINAKEDEGDTPLAWAAYTGQIEVLANLIELGANINTQNKKGITPLYWAAYRGYVDILKFLIEHEADVSFKNERNETPLTAAIRVGQIEIVKFLINMNDKSHL